MHKEIEVGLYLSQLKDIERRVYLRAQKMFNAIKLGAKLDEQLLNKEEIPRLRQHNILSDLRNYTEFATKQFIDAIIEEIDDISLLNSIEMANEEITPGYFQQLKKLKHQVLLTRKKLEEYNIPELAKHVDATIKCIESSQMIKYNYSGTTKPKHSNKQRQYTVTKPARYVPFPMR